MRLTLEGDDRCPQRAVVRATGSRCGEGQVITAAAADLFFYASRNASGRERAAFPTHRVIAGKDSRLFPAAGANNSIKS